MTETQGTLRDWMRKVEVDLARLDDKWQKSVDDIKSIIREEISDLKNEQISDLRRRVEIGYQTLDLYDKRLREMEMQMNDWNAGRRILTWLMHFLIGVGALVAGFFGGKHIG